MIRYRLSSKIILFAPVLFMCIFGFFINASGQIEEEILYPTLISVQYMNGSILITFETLKDEQIQYRIYRSKNPIENTENLKEAILLAQITNKELPYTDKPDKDGKYYYAVTAIKGENEYKELVPFQNFILMAVDYSPMPESVQSLKLSSVQNQTLEITFTPLRENYTYRLYISSKMINEPPDVEPWAVLSEKEKHFSVKIEPEKPYFFFVSSVNRLGVENKTILPGENATTQAFVLKKPEEKPQKVKKEKKPPVVSASKLIADNLRHNFYMGKYKRAIDVFQNILKNQRLSVSQRATAHFYMGQCYYYRENYIKAIHYFILSKELTTYRNKADIWIDRCLEKVE